MKTLRLPKLSVLEWNATAALAILVCIPSLKLFYSSSIFNLLPLCILLINFLVFSEKKNSAKIYTSKSIFLTSVLIAFVFIVGFSFISFEHSAISLKIISKYFVMSSLLILIILHYQYLNLELFLKFIVLWSVFLGIYHLLIGFTFDSSKGQHYLTLGLPMGAGMTVAFLSLITAIDKKTRRKHLYVACFLFICILLSRARSSLLFPIAIVLIYLIISMLLGKRKKKSFFILAGITSLLICGYLYLIQFTNLRALQRIQSASSDGFEDSRTFIWSKTIDLIRKNPFGYGVESYNELLDGSYPHNLFLETTLSFGIIGLSLVLALTIAFFYQILVVCKRGNQLSLVRFGFLSMYFFFCWNTSYDLSTAYIPLSMMVAFISFNNKYPIIESRGISQKIPL